MKKLVLTILINIFFFTACSKEKKTTLDQIRVGYFLNITHPQAILGIGRGDFQKAVGEKIEVKSTIFNAGPAAVMAFMAGELDIGYMGPGPALNAYSKSGGEIIIIAGACKSGSLLVIQPNSSIRKIKNLAGKKIATPQLSNTQDIMLRYLLDKAGLKDSLHGGDVDLINISSSGIFTLFIQKDIEAALVPEPWGTRLIEEAGAKILMDENEIYRNGDYPVTVFVAKKDFVKQYPDIIKKWLEVHSALTQEINTSCEGVKKYFLTELAKTARKDAMLSDQLLNSAFKRIKPETGLNMEAMQDFANILYQGKYIRDPINLNDAVKID